MEAVGADWARLERERRGALPSETCYRPGMKLELGIPLWLLFGIIGAWIATTKGRSGCFWFLFCSVLGPIGLVLAAVISRNKGD